ncbi:phosphatidylinositol mannoside acyltransferase [Plantactinospora sp. GCM10030261]|uniref:phosphatidylinositol mannoside acyltransferase n=1 Tax=Plantactinospora sp. GCM10030261 TaxID=3273420 RepID=UPI00360B4EFA
MNIADLGYAAAWRLTRTLPRPVAAAAFAAGADQAYRRRGRGVLRLAGNLRRVIGPEPSEAELDDLVRRGMRSYARYFMEAFRLPALTREQVRIGFRLDGEEVLAADVAAGRGAVVALPHAGNWDAAGAWVAAMGWPLATVAERLKPESVYQRFLDFRRGLGMEIVPLTGGEQAPIEVLCDRLAKGYVVPLLADRDLSARGIPVDFFGGRTRMPAGPALLALRTGAPLYTAEMWFEPDAPCARLVGPISVPDPGTGTLAERVAVLTQRIADQLAAGIAAHPEDWHMLQRLWLDVPETAGPAGSTAGPAGSTADPTGSLESSSGPPGASGPA